MQPSLRSSAVLLAAVVAAPVSSIAAQVSNLVVSPFVSFLPSAAMSPLAGLALTLGGSGAFALRGSAHLALENSNNGVTTSGTVRPWGADADALFLFGGQAGRSVASRGIMPFAFVGIGTQTADDLGFNTTTHNWSYGAGASVPIGTSVDLFGEGRWRLSRYVLPTASMAPATTKELRFGVSFHVGSNGSNGQRPPRGRRIDVHME